LLENWKSINWGRTLEIWRGPDEESGHQLATPVGRLDFLCVDPDADALVVMELKRGRPSDKVVGQVARYIGYVSSHLAKPGQAVEGLIVAHESDDALRYAVSALPGLELMTYEVSFQLSPVESPKVQGAARL
jgi:RecB family endonuclease NucS